MPVAVNNVSKHFGTQKAVDQISFTANKGEILGFLGPNGAGKSTTMKMITGFYPQTSGDIKVCGLDTLTHSKEIKKKIGYLPEHNPLYKDMYVTEYLNFIGGIYHIKNKKSRVEEMIELTGLTRERHKIIGTLSKGYRQRVGLAQAMIHDPEVLILDEPTSGLDPNQLVEIRELIRTFGKEKTVIFSSHIMQEVQELCDRVVIINKGTLVANDDIQTVKNKAAQGATLLLELDDHVELQLPMKQIQKIESLDNRTWRIHVDGEKDIRRELFQYCVQNNWTILTLQKETTTVENAFQILTTQPS